MTLAGVKAPVFKALIKLHEIRAMFKAIKNQ